MGKNIQTMKDKQKEESTTIDHRTAHERSGSISDIPSEDIPYASGVQKWVALYTGFTFSFVTPQKDPGSGDHSCVMSASAYDGLYRGQLLVGELKDVFVFGIHIPQTYHPTLQMGN